VSVITIIRFVAFDTSADLRLFSETCPGASSWIYPETSEKVETNITAKTKKRHARIIINKNI
jgi:hypothetical protein